MFIIFDKQFQRDPGQKKFLSIPTRVLNAGLQIFLKIRIKIIKCEGWLAGILPRNLSKISSSDVLPQLFFPKMIDRSSSKLMDIFFSNRELLTLIVFIFYMATFTPTTSIKRP